MKKRIGKRMYVERIEKPVDIEADLMPLEEVRARWNAMSGQNISRKRLHQILSGAESKLYHALRRVGREMFE